MPFFVGKSGALFQDEKGRKPDGELDGAFDRLTAAVRVEDDGEDPGMEACDVLWMGRHSRAGNQAIRCQSMATPLEQVARDTADETVRAFCSLFGASCRYHYRYRN